MTSRTSSALSTEHSALTQSRWVLIVGASSGIGRAVAHRWAQEGTNLLLAGRDEDDLHRTAADLAIRHQISAEVVPIDALDFARHESFWQECLAKAQSDLEGVILVHGSLPAQSDVQKDLDLVRRTIDTNYTSAATLLTLAANYFEPLHRGFLCVFSSVAGDRGRQSNYVYGSAKAGTTAFLQGLRNRLFKSGVTVVTIKPGFVDTGMIFGMSGVVLAADPAKVAADTYRAVRRGRNVVYTPWFWRYIMLIVRAIPETIFKRMKL